VLVRPLFLSQTLLCSQKCTANTRPSGSENEAVLPHPRRRRAVAYRRPADSTIAVREEGLFEKKSLARRVGHLLWCHRAVTMFLYAIERRFR
jgi:hypothetical protein